MSDADAMTPEEAIEDLREMVHAWDTSDDPAYYDERPYGAGVEDTWNRVKSVLALVRPVEGPSAREIADWFDREAEPGDPTDWRLRTARTIRHEWDLS